MSHGIWAVTGKINVRYRDLIPLYQPVTVIGRIEKNRRRWPLVRAEVQFAGRRSAVGGRRDLHARLRRTAASSWKSIYRGMTIDDVVEGALSSVARTWAG